MPFAPAATGRTVMNDHEVDPRVNLEMEMIAHNSGRLLEAEGQSA